MEIRIARHAGFCSGVSAAVQGALKTAQEAKEKGLPCFTLGELIHNPLVVQELEQKGISAIKSPEEALGGLLVIRSHGVSPELLNRCMALAQVRDCTCPVVRQVHKTVSDWSEKGKPVLILGDPDHPEIIGILGWCHGLGYAVPDEAALLNLPPDLKEALVLCQTTFQPQKWESLSLKIKEIYPDSTLHCSICQATRLRQEAAIELAKQSDLMIVVGGKNSANTRKLADSCKQWCKDTLLVESAEELPPKAFILSHQIIGVTAGASTPAWSLKEVVNTMNDIERNDLVPPVPAEETAAAPLSTASEEAAPVTPAASAAAPVAPQAPAEPSAPAEPEPAQKEVSFMDQVAASMTRIRNGQTVSGKVIEIRDDEICVNIGYKSEGLVKRSDLVDVDLKLGDEIQVEIVKVNDGEGNVILSQRNIINRKVWAELVSKREAGEIVDGKGIEAVKGGLIASIDGVRAFIPASHLANHYVDNINQFVGQPLRLKIIEMDETKKRVVASRKEAVTLENAAKREASAAEKALKKSAAWEKLEVGATVNGIVRRFTSFGVFVDLGGVDGLIHVTELSWQRAVNPESILKIGQQINVLILSLDQERERIQLSYKQLQPQPWDNIEEKYPIGTILTRKVVRICPFGAFVALEPGVDGLVHISQCALTRINKVEDALQVDQDVKVKVLSIDTAAKRISLSVREALEDAAFMDPNAAIPGDELEIPDTLSLQDEVEAAPAEEVVEEAVEEAAEDSAE